MPTSPPPPSPPVNPPPPPPPPPGAPPSAEKAWAYSEWQELIAASCPSGADLFSETSESAALSVVIQNGQRRDFMFKTLGYTWCERTTPFRMHRVNPMPHPFWGFIYATQVGFTPFNPAGNPVDPDGKPKVTVTGTSFPVAAYSNYTHCHAVVNFGALPYSLREDFEFGSTTFLVESDRNVDWFANTTGEVQVISAETGRQLTFTEGPVGNPGPAVSPPPPPGVPPPPSVAKSFQGEIGEYVVKANFTWKWFCCASEYLLNAAGLPSKILKGLGKVNLTAFRGHPAGTLLLTSFNLERYVLPWRLVPEFGGTGTEPAFAYNVTFIVSQFDPDPAVLSMTPPGVPLFRGHNLQAWAATVDKINNSIWYAATRGGKDDDPRYLPSYEFAKLFEPAQGP